MTSDPTGCLSDDELLAVLEESASSGASAIAHVDTCESCQERLNVLTEPEGLASYRHLAARSQITNQIVLTDEELVASFGRYRIERLLGQGGMGTVYKALDTELNRTLAIKVLSNTSDAAQVRRFEREASALSKLTHPNVVPILTSGVSTDGRQFIVMPFVDGKSLQQALTAGPLQPKRAAEIVKQVALGLEAAHRQGLMHRDVKPSNILVDARDGTAKLLDFGLVRSVDDETLTQTEVLCGTPLYMAPERGDKSQQDNALSDVYSLGITLYQCITGSVPFRGSPLEVLEQHRREEPVAPRRLNRAIDRELETICLKTLAKSPADRYVSAAALADDLGNFLAGKPIMARPIGPIGRMWRWSLRNVALATASALLVTSLLLGTTLTTFLWRQSVANARDAEAKNESLLASQQVMRENQAALRASIRNSFHDRLQDRSTFVQLPTSIRNTTLISLAQSYQLMLETIKNDSAALREISDELSEAADFAMSFFMNLRAAELTHIGREAAESLVLQTELNVEDQFLIARAHVLFAEARIALHGGVIGDQAVLAQVDESLKGAQRTIDDLLTAMASSIETTRGSIELLKARAVRCELLSDPALENTNRLQGLGSLLVELGELKESGEVELDRLNLQSKVLADQAQLQTGNASIESLIECNEVLQVMVDHQLQGSGMADSMTLRFAAMNYIAIGSAYKELGNHAEALEYFNKASKQLQSLTEVYALAGHFRVSWFEALKAIAQVKWEEGDRSQALESYLHANRQIELLAQLNPQDEKVHRRAALIQAELGDHYVEQQESERAAELYLSAGKYAKRTADNPFRMNPDNTEDLNLAVELFEKASQAFASAGFPDLAESSKKSAEAIPLKN
ncbi:MAG: protein kinase [Planctomycetales bacterium]|nr:protein kinase [Planctomycetales bacterium]